LANATAMLAGRGLRHTPRLLREVQHGIGDARERVPAPAPEQVVHREDDWLTVERGMIEVVRSGPARGIDRDFPYTIAGKTGTAERYSRTDETWTSISTSPIERHQVLFVAFTPAEDPRIAVIVALEAGRSGGRDAAPIVRRMLDAWLP